MADTNIINQPDDNNGTFLYEGSKYPGQSFTAPSTFSVNEIHLWMKKWNSPGDVTMYLFEADGSGHPTGSALASDVLNGNLFTGGAHVEETWVFDIRVNLISGQQYVFYYTVAAPDFATGSTQTLQEDSGNIYAGGEHIRSTDAGSSWLDQTDADLRFEIWGDGDRRELTQASDTIRFGRGKFGSSTFGVA